MKIAFVGRGDVFGIDVRTQRLQTELAICAVRRRHGFAMTRTSTFRSLVLLTNTPLNQHDDRCDYRPGCANWRPPAPSTFCTNADTFPALAR